MNPKTACAVTKAEFHATVVVATWQCGWNTVCKADPDIMATTDDRLDIIRCLHEVHVNDHADYDPT